MTTRAMAPKTAMRFLRIRAQASCQSERPGSGAATGAVEDSGEGGASCSMVIRRAASG